jgi:hypothetical protein
LDALNCDDCGEKAKHIIREALGGKVPEVP